MKRLFRFRLTLRAGTVREGLLLSLGENAWSEAVPSVRRSRETLKEVEEQLMKYETLPREELHPSVAFCVESAELQLKEPLRPPFYPVRTARLLQGENMLEEAEVLAQEGTELVKVKVGPLAYDEAKELLNQLKKRFRLRVEFNRMWHAHDAARLLKECDVDLDFAEEPGKSKQELNDFPFPFALDETLQEKGELPRGKNLKTLVFKPTLLGGESRFLEIAALAQEHGLELILSSAFEGPIGLFQVASLFYRLPQPTLAHGLGTAAYWKKKTPGCSVKGNFLHFTEAALFESYDEITPLPVS